MFVLASLYAASYSTRGCCHLESMNWFRGELFKVLFGARHRLVIQRCLTTIKMDDILLKHRVKLDHKQLPLIVIIGATGCGKTKLSIELAQKYNGEVINADAMQVRFFFEDIFKTLNLF